MKKILAVVLALALCAAPIVLAATQDTEVSVGGYTTRTLVNLLYQLQTTVNEITSSSSGLNKNNAVLNNWNTAITEVMADHDADNTALAGWETLVEEVAADHDADNTALAGWETLVEEVAADHDADNDVVNQVANTGVVQTHGALLGFPDLAAGSNTQFVQTQNAVVYTVDGLYYDKAATDDFCDCSGLTEIGAGNYNKITLAINVDGNCNATEATQGGNLDAIDYPAQADNSIVLGGIYYDDAHNFATASVATNGTFVQPYTMGLTMSQVAADLDAGTTVDSVAANLAAGVTVDSVAANLTAGATSNVSDISITDSTLGSGTETDPSISLTI